jgi:ABC-2 type transport system ATP-binding protein
MTTDLAVEAVGLVKSYGPTRVLADVDLVVPRGMVFSLLGPNGAGKTTMVRILATLLRPDAGHARVAGHDVVRARGAVRRAISLTGQYAAVDELQTGEENLRLMGRLAGLDRAAARRRAAVLLERFDLTAAARKRVGQYSGGMRRRLDLAAGLLGQPAVIFLDEPTTGLDPRSRQAMWEIITGLVGAGATVFLTTQYLDEADHLADRIAVLDAGRIVADDTPTALKTRFAEQRLDLTARDTTAYADLARLLGDRAVYRDPARHTLGVATDGSAAHIRSVLDRVDPDRSAIATFAVHSATLDDVFLALTGHLASDSPSTADQKELARV